MDYVNETGEDYSNVYTPAERALLDALEIDHEHYLETVDRRAALEDIGRRIARDGFINAERLG